MKHLLSRLGSLTPALAIMLSPFAVSAATVGAAAHALEISAPSIDIVTQVEPRKLPPAGGDVKHTYVVTNKGNVALSNVKIIQGDCDPVTFSGGDGNGDNKLDVTEIWQYACTTSMKETASHTVEVTAEWEGVTVSHTHTHTVIVGGALLNISLLKSVGPDHLPVGGGSVEGRHDKMSLPTNGSNRLPCVTGKQHPLPQFPRSPSPQPECHFLPRGMSQDCQK